MINAQQVHHGCLQVVDVDSIFGNVVTQLTGFAINRTGLDSSTRHPHRETTWMMISAKVRLNFALAIVGSAELASPYDERVVQHSSLFQILYEGRCRLVGLFANGWQHIR